MTAQKLTPRTAPLSSKTSTSSLLARLRRPVAWSRASAAIGATALVSAAAVEVARAWTAAPAPGVEAQHAASGMVVGLLLVASLALASRVRSLSVLPVLASFALLAHGLSLVLHAEAIGAIFAGLAPLVAALTRATMRGAWTPTFPSPRIALVAQLAASRRPSITLA